MPRASLSAPWAVTTEDADIQIDPSTNKIFISYVGSDLIPNPISALQSNWVFRCDDGNWINVSAPGSIADDCSFMAMELHPTLSTPAIVTGDFFNRMEVYTYPQAECFVQVNGRSCTNPLMDALNYEFEFVDWSSQEAFFQSSTLQTVAPYIPAGT